MLFAVKKTVFRQGALEYLWEVHQIWYFTVRLTIKTCFRSFSESSWLELNCIWNQNVSQKNTLRCSKYRACNLRGPFAVNVLDMMEPQTALPLVLLYCCIILTLVLFKQIVFRFISVCVMCVWTYVSQLEAYAPGPIYRENETPLDRQRPRTLWVCESGGERTRFPSTEI